MSVAFGLLFGTGLLLLFSPLLWPASPRPVSRRSWSASIDARLAQAGLSQVPASTVVVISLLAAVVAAALVLAVLPILPLGLAAGVLALLAPSFVIRARASARRRAARTVWPDVLDHLVSAVRAGQSLPESLAALSEGGPTATRDAFSIFAADYRATGNFATCVTELKERLGDPTADRLLETLRMSREVGGSELTAVLRNLAAYLRQETALRSEVEARQSWVVNAARLGVAAPWVVLALLATRPEAAVAYNTAAGAVLVVSGLVITVVAYRVMMAIGRIPEERRWFR